jgi:hypothetical protein
MELKAYFSFADTLVPTDVVLLVGCFSTVVEIYYLAIFSSFYHGLMRCIRSCTVIDRVVFKSEMFIPCS